MKLQYFAKKCCQNQKFASLECQILGSDATTFLICLKFREVDAHGYQWDWLIVVPYLTFIWPWCCEYCRTFWHNVGALLTTKGIFPLNWSPLLIISYCIPLPCSFHAKQNRINLQHLKTWSNPKNVDPVLHQLFFEGKWVKCFFFSMGFHSIK